MHREQPNPIKNDREEIWKLVIKDMEKRNSVGIERYGVPLQAFNGRDSLQDAYEEALDLAVYLRQRIEEEKELTLEPFSRLYCATCDLTLEDCIC
jgi:hypothetical protein